MLILVNGATATVRRHPECGILVSPRCGNSMEGVASTGRPWAADNDAFLAWNEPRFLAMCERIRAVDRSRFLWLAVPDVVGDAAATLDRWAEWSPRLAGLPLAFVAQDGLESLDASIPWDELACLFVGGSTDWKLGIHAEALAAEAKARGKWVHVGRVNTKRRIRHAVEMGADSIDGRSFSAWPDKKIPWGLAAVRSVKRQLRFV